MRIVKQNRFKNLGELHKEWTEAGVKASRGHHTQTCPRNLATVVTRRVLPGLKRRRSGLLSSGPKSSFQMRASFVFHTHTHTHINLTLWCFHCELLISWSIILISLIPLFPWLLVNTLQYTCWWYMFVQQCCPLSHISAQRTDLQLSRCRVAVIN